MGASNFARGNTSKVFAVLMNEERTFKECSECGQRHYDWEYNLETLTECENNCEDAELTEESEWAAPESYEYDDFKNYLQERAEEKAKRTVFSYNDEDYSDNDRNYCATDLFSLQTSKSYGDIEVELKITGQIVSAYYEGASLDYRLEFYNGYDWEEGLGLDNLFDTNYDSTQNSDMNRGLRKIMLPKVTKWAEKETEKMIELIEEIFTEVSMPLVVTAQFSNGETI